MPFLTPKITITAFDDETWSLDHPLIYQGQTQTFTVPAGFCTDFATVPRVAVWLIPKYGKWTLAAILHDYFCTIGIEQGLVTPVETDGLFRRIMRELGVSPARRWLMWTGVRWGALFNPKRRAGWHKTAIPVLALSVVALPIVAIPAVLIMCSLLVFHVVDLLTGGGNKLSLKT